MACLPWELRVQKAEDALGGDSKLWLARCLAEPHLQPQTLIQLSSPRCSTRAVSLDAMSEKSLCRQAPCMRLDPARSSRKHEVIEKAWFAKV